MSIADLCYFNQSINQSINYLPGNAANLSLGNWVLDVCVGLIVMLIKVILVTSLLFSSRIRIIMLVLSVIPQ